MSLKVKHFSVTGKLIRHYMMLHNNICFNSKGSKVMATKITKNRQF